MFTFDIKSLKFITLLFTITIVGCSPLKHLDEIRHLQEFSEKGEQLDQYVEQRNKQFDQLVKAVKEERIMKFPDQKSVLEIFGKPIMVRNTNEDGQLLEEWLYRYQTVYYDTDMVYLYFNKEGQLVKHKYTEGD